jgi:antitoxin VapB
MPIVTSRTFKSGNSEAVRLPRDVAFGADVEVTIIRSGEVLTVYPKRPRIGDLVGRLEAMPKPPTIESRDNSTIPERRER